LAKYKTGKKQKTPNRKKKNLLDDPQQKKWFYFGTDRGPDLLKCNARLIFIHPPEYSKPPESP
jgi:hypothetical protein